jgi:2-phospho-L-lactate/phosphoenolpyruvate guanylyltransferase
VRTAAILPVKSFSRAKQRLGPSVADRLRAALAEAMVGDVLSALAQTRGIDATIVVTKQAEVAARAASEGAVVVHDEHEHGQSAAVMLGVERALAKDIERVLCVPGDCPALDPAELAMLLSDREHQVTILPDRHGSGTNGLLLCPPDAIPPSFGPNSRERHCSLARAAGVRWQVREVASVGLDVDTGADLAALCELIAGSDEMAAGTRAVLGDPVNAADPGLGAAAQPEQC